MMSFHFPPIAATAAVSGHPSTGFGRRPLPPGSFFSSSEGVCSFIFMTDAPIVEVRTYHIKPGYRHEFVELFRERARPAQELYGMKVLGPLLDLENPNV